MVTYLLRVIQLVAVLLTLGVSFAQGLVREWLHDICCWNAGSQALLAWSGELCGPRAVVTASCGPRQPPACVRCPGSEGQPRAQHIWEGAHQTVVKRNEGGRLLKVRILCEGAFFFFYFSILKFFKSFRKLKFILWTHIPYPPTQGIIVFLIPSDIFLLHFLLYHVLDHILVVLIFLLCFRLYYLAVACFW